ncbi:MAG: carbohydrate ABC transporter permease [Chloroflexota bacterium]|nr:carbohydrate ABC transporter permease [Chloroflexota bacterium]
MAINHSRELATPRVLGTRQRSVWRLGSLRLVGLSLAAAALAVVWVLPLAWVLMSTFKGQFELIGPEARFLPNALDLANWRALFDPNNRAVNIVVASMNSLIVALVSTAGALFTSSLAGYAFARLNFPGKGPLFVVLLATMMIPFEVILVPLFIQFDRFNLLDSYAALVLPHVVSVFGIFLMRQFMQGIPRDLEDAARMDGASVWQVYFQIVLPLTRPALATLGVFVFLGSWNDFLWPLIVVSSPDRQTLPLALITFRSAYGGMNYGTVLASVVLAVAPPLLFFLFAQRLVVQSISRSGLKG